MDGRIFIGWIEIASSLKRLGRSRIILKLHGRQAKAVMSFCILGIELQRAAIENGCLFVFSVPKVLVAIANALLTQNFWIARTAR